jgi:hypothetical protein
MEYCCDLAKEYIRFEQEPNAYIGPKEKGYCIKIHSEVDTLGRLKWSKFKWLNVYFCPWCGDLL